MCPSSGQWRAASAALAAAAVVLAGVAVGAAAATTTDVAVAPASDSLEPGEETVVEVVVEDADGGVGAVNATVTLSDPAVATVENVTLHGDPGLSTVTERADGVEVSAALADTDDSGRVTVATVVVRAERSGETAVEVNVRALGDEDGAKYAVGSVDRPTLSVAGSDSGGDGGGQPDETGVGSQQTDADGGDSGSDTGGDAKGADGTDESGDDAAESDDSRDGSADPDGADSTTNAGPDDSDDSAGQPEDGADRAGGTDEQPSGPADRNPVDDGTGGAAGGWPLPVESVLVAGAVVGVGAAGGFVLYRFG